MSHHDPARRLLSLLLVLYAEHGKVRFTDLRDLLPEYDTPNPESGRRKFERDKETLEALGIILTYLGDEEHTYQLDLEGSFLPLPVGLEQSERALLSALSFSALGEGGSPYPTALRVALSKLGVSPKAVEGVLVHHPVRDSDPDLESKLECLTDAVLRYKHVSFTYHAGRQRRDWVLAPYGVFLKRGHWYLCGLGEGHSRVRCFRLSRLTDLELVTPHRRRPEFEVPADFRLDEHTSFDPNLFCMHEPIEVEIQVDQEVDHVVPKSWGSGSPHGDKTRFRFESTNTDAVIEKVLRLGKRALIVRPHLLRQRMRHVLDAILEAHDHHDGPRPSRDEAPR